VGKPKEKRPLGKDLDVGGSIILNWISENRMGWYGLDSSGSG
jgi:hypothetical protein